MKNFDCNQIKFFINLKIIGEDKDKIYICISLYFFFFNLKKFMQFSEAIQCNHGF